MNSSKIIGALMLLTLGLAVLAGRQVVLITDLTTEVRNVRTQVQALQKSLKRLDTRPQIAAVPSPSSPRVPGKSISESHGPRGPMPVSIAVKSDRQAGDPEHGKDVTSRIRRKAIDPCEVPCNRLSTCALDRKFCPAMDTRKQDGLVDLCLAECGRSEGAAKRIIGATECGRAIKTASRQIKGFSALCSGGK